MSDGILRNCASGACCPPPVQAKALAMVIHEVETTGTIHARAFGDEIDESFLLTPSGERCLKIARGLISEGLIGMPMPAFRKWVRWALEPSPSEQELEK